MEIGSLQDIGDDVWHRLSSGHSLSKEQENLLKAHIEAGDFKDVPAAVKQLRENSKCLQQKSVEEVSKMMDHFKEWSIVEADKSLQSAIVSEWKAAGANAQANRIQNTANQTEARMRTVAEVMGIQYVYPDPRAASGRTTGSARAAASHQAATQAANQAATPQRQECLGQGSIDGVQTARNASSGNVRPMSIMECARLQAGR